MDKIIFYFVILFSITKNISAQNNLKLVKEKDGIRVFVGPVSGSEYYAFKAVMSVKTGYMNIIQILKDADNYPEWFAFTASAKLINPKENEHQFFLETDYPWPYSNECMNYSMKFSKRNDNTEEITITGNAAKTHCKYSLQKASGYIILEQDGVGTKITYFFHSEPSQRIPPWLINPRIHEMPFQTFTALRKKLYSLYKN